MTSAASKNTAPAQGELFITRVFNAPRELVFAAWTDAAQLPRWYAPNGCTIRFTHLDIRTGGSFHSCIRTPDGFECWCRGVYADIVKPERIVYTMAVTDEQGRVVEAADVGHDDAWPRETIITVTFTEKPGGKTELTLHQTVNEALAKRTGAHPSWLQMLDRLEAGLV